MQIAGNYKTNEREIFNSLVELNDEYNKRIIELKKRISSSTDLRLKVCKHKNTYQCYIRNVKTDSIKFINRNDPLVQRLAQRDYDIEQLKVIEKRKKVLERILKELDISQLQLAFSSLSEGRKNLVDSPETDDLTFRNKWESEKYEAEPFFSDRMIHMTSKGEQVRSKSEVMIADELARMDIPYKYEHPIVANGNRYYPDFTILNMKTRREIIWEHFGMLDDMGYREEAIRKIRDYEIAGYKLGVNLFFTVETIRSPLTRYQIVSRIKSIIGDFKSSKDA